MSVHYMPIKNYKCRQAVRNHNLITVNGPPMSKDVGRILRTFKIKKNVEVTDNGKDDF